MQVTALTQSETPANADPQPSAAPNAADVLIWCPADSPRLPVLRNMLERRGLSQDHFVSAARLVIQLARRSARLILVVQPEAADETWARRADDLKKLVQRRTPHARFLLVQAPPHTESPNTPEQTGVQKKEHRPQHGWGIQDPSSMRPPEITQEELSMLLGPYPGEESA